MRKLLAVLVPTLVLCQAHNSPAQSGLRAKKDVGLVYEWRSIAGEPDQLALFKNKTQLGNWSIAKQEYRPLVAAGWGKPCEPPFPVPEWALDDDWVPEEEPILNFGVMQQAMSPRPFAHADRLELNGKPAERTQVMRAIEKGVPNDAGKFRLTIIGSDAERALVEKDWQAAPAELREKTLVWSVPSDHWSLRDNVSGAAMFVTTGQPTVYFTDSRGKVLYHEDDYHGPADIEAIRRAAVAYDAHKDPGRSATGVPPILWILGGAAGGAGLILFGRRHAAHPAG